jgi:hypothetical protein
LIPDCEKLTSDYLRTHAEVSTLTSRIVGKTPSDTSDPWVRVTQLDASNQTLSRPEHLIEYLIQFDCYAGVDGGQPEAKTLASTVREALADMPGATYDGAVCTNARFTGMARIPDTDFEPARERVILDATIWMHP